MDGRTVLIPGTRTAMPHQWLGILQESKGYDPVEVEAFAAGQIQRKVVRAQTPHKHRSRSGRTPHRNPARINRLAKNGRLRKDLQ